MATVRVLLIVGAVGGLTAWVVAQGTAVPAATPVVSASRAEAARETGGRPDSATARDAAFDVEINRLRAGLGLMPSPSPSGRNPFRFGANHSTGRRPPTPQPRVALASEAPEGTGGAAPDRPPMQLLGVAADVAGAAPVRTAVIATPRQLYLVRDGEQIGLRFQVLRISDDVVELHDLATDETFQLALR